MHECTNIIMNSLHLFLIFFFMPICFFDSFLIKGSFKKYVRCGGKRVLKKQTETNRGGEGCQAYLYVLSVTKNSLIFQTANRVLSDKLLGSC